MKNLSLFIILLFAFTPSLHAQKTSPDTLHFVKSYSCYMQKRNTNNTIGWVCLGGGFTIAALGLLIDIGSAFNHGSSSKGDGIAIAGEIVMLGSIPFFISAHHNKKKARNLNKGL